MVHDAWGGSQQRRKWDQYFVRFVGGWTVVAVGLIVSMYMLVDGE
jgi:hypothetical protein